MTEYGESPEPELDIQYFDENVLWIGATGVSTFSEGETLAQGLILEYDQEGNAVGVVLTRSALQRLKELLYKSGKEYSGTAENNRKIADGI